MMRTTYILSRASSVGEGWWLMTGRANDSEGRYYYYISLCKTGRQVR